MLIFFISLSATQAQSTLKGKITDKDSGEPLPFANIDLRLDNKTLSRAQSDFDGNFIFKNVAPNTYTIRVACIGYKPVQISNIELSIDSIKHIDIKMQPTTIEMQEFVMVEYKNRLIDKSHTTVKRTVSEEDFTSIAIRSTSEVSMNTAGVYDPNSQYKYQLPPSNETYSAITDNNFKDVAFDPLSTFSIDVDKASYTNVRRFINSGQLPPKEAVRIEEMVNYFDYDYPQPKDDKPFSITTEYTKCPWDSSHKLVHIGIQGKQIEFEDAAPSNLVFLIDVSGSMSSHDKLGLVKTGLHLLVDQLRPQDQVAIVVYAGAAGLVLPSTNGEHKSEIHEAIENLSAGGSTAGGAGINLAYKVAKQHFIKDGNNRIILASDGDFNVGISSREGLVKLIEEKRNQGIFLTVLGFGTGNIKDATMEQLADKGNGNYNYIDNALEAKKVFVTELGGNLITIAKDVKVQVEFNPAAVKGYRLIGYVNRNLNNEDFNDDLKDAGEIGSGHNVTMMYEIILTESDEEFSDIDPLKYRKDSESLVELNHEVLTIKFRYKDPKASKSKLITEVLYNEPIPFVQTSNNCKFSVSVASFGMLLRDSEYSGSYAYSDVIELAQNSKGTDDDGSRSEFIQLVEMVAVLDRN
ncbi:von Willebrand factor type A domain-containing protein [bacterium SCSIO 12643]|nr:von Willebrand factor type A domain-containing protein [bacterium SCSIO 12643]